MATALAARLHSAFENNGALKLRADHFLVVLSALGTSVTAAEGALIVESLGMDSEGCVDVRKFCAWFEGMEQDPRFAQLLQSLGSKRQNEGTVLPVAGGDDSPPSAQGGIFGEEEVEGHDVFNPNDNGSARVVGD
eukprot:TRINITY_DN15206_c0_g1_i1.p1 TRINITY_DN15206_c0_g1~~TRINITY_DN15206_c0_g1_i1.p1  ORF type:complete len:135 (-),score=31.20 TRINITY_DN15206_c0_g1_i1:26-430(-)